MEASVKGICVECGRYPEINKKYHLCSFCNFKRLHEGKSMQEVEFEKRKNKPLKIYKPIRQVSSRKALINKQLSETYHKIDIEREPVCQGCGRGDKPLSHSHTIPQSKREDLITDPNNIELECYGDQSCCHEIWERKDSIKAPLLMNFERKMKYIEEKDKEYYNKLLNKFNLN